MTWRFPRFTTLQLLLAAAFCALVLGLATASWRSSSLAQVTAVGYSPGGKYLAARYASGFILVWDVSDSRPRRVASFASSSPWAYDASGLHFANDHTLVDVPTRWTGSAIVGEVRTLDLATGHVQTRFAYHGTSDGVLFAAAADTVALVEWPAGNIACYSLASGRLVQRIACGVPGWGLALTPDGRTLVVPDQTGAVSVCDVASGNVVHKEPAQGVTTAAISGEGQHFAFVSWQLATAIPSVHVRDLQADASRTVDHDLAAASWVSFANQGSRLAIAGSEAAEVHDLASSRRIGRVVFDRELTPPDWLPWTAKWRSYRGHSHFSISPDGRTLATFDGSRVHLWDTPTGKLRATASGHSGTLQVVLFTGLFAFWSAAWGIVARREHQRLIPAFTAARTPTITPVEIKLCWGMMLIGGLVSLGASIAMILWFGPLIWPMFYVALFTGVAAISRGAARDRRGLVQVATLQLCNIAACDPVNFLLGTLAHSLLRRPHIRQFLHQATGAAH